MKAVWIMDHLIKSKTTAQVSKYLLRAGYLLLLAADVLCRVHDSCKHHEPAAACVLRREFG